VLGHFNSEGRLYCTGRTTTLSRAATVGFSGLSGARRPARVPGPCGAEAAR
jgi:hypothetical protein